MTDEKGIHERLDALEEFQRAVSADLYIDDKTGRKGVIQDHTDTKQQLSRAVIVLVGLLISYIILLITVAMAVLL